MSSLVQDTLRAAGWIRQTSGGSWRSRWFNEKPTVAVQAAIDPVESRDYCTGDDLTRVDWNRCARLDELVVRQYFGNELKAIDLWIDHSHSMSAASGPDSQSKLEWAKRFAAMIAVHAACAGESVCMHRVADRALRLAPPIHARQHLPRLLPQLETAEPFDAPLDLAASARSYLASNPRADTLVILTDFFDPTASRLVQALQLLNAAQKRICLLQLHTDEEFAPGATGRFQLQNLEGPDALTTVLNARDLKLYEAEVVTYLTAIRKVCHRAGVLWARVNVHSRWDDLLEMLGRTSRLGRRR